MKHLIIACAAILAMSCATETPESAYPITYSEEQKEALRYLKEVEWSKAYREQDTALLDRILADEFQMIDASGNWSDKESELKWIVENQYSPDSFYYEIKRFEFLENGTAIVSGTGHIWIDTSLTLYESSNYLLMRDGTWQAFASHVSGIRPANQ